MLQLPCFSNRVNCEYNINIIVRNNNSLQLQAPSFGLVQRTLPIDVNYDFVTSFWRTLGPVTPPPRNEKRETRNEKRETRNRTERSHRHRETRNEKWQRRSIGVRIKSRYAHYWQQYKHQSAKYHPFQGRL